MRGFFIGCCAPRLRRCFFRRDDRVRTYAHAYTGKSALHSRRSSTWRYECRLRREREPASDGETSRDWEGFAEATRKALRMRGFFISCCAPRLRRCFFRRDDRVRTYAHAFAAKIRLALATARSSGISRRSDVSSPWEVPDNLYEMSEAGFSESIPKTPFLQGLTFVSPAKAHCCPA